MNEIQAIVDMNASSEHDPPIALATVVGIEGSVYRRPGARMLITASGKTAGMISGGCLESDVRERAFKVAESGKPDVITYDSTAPEDIVFGLGLGCSGIVKVLIEPAKAQGVRFLMKALDGTLKNRVPVASASVVGCMPDLPNVLGSRLVKVLGCEAVFSGNPEVRHVLEQSLVLESKSRQRVLQLPLATGNLVEVLVEHITPAPDLVIFGAGDDAIPVAGFAKELGWKVSVIDHREAYITSERFPTADNRVCAHPDSSLPNSGKLVGPETLAVIMTHHYVTDKAILGSLLKLNLRYLGILGPKSRTCRLMEDLEEEQGFGPASFAQLHSPCGLDIGAETPEEVALSIISEMQAMLQDRPGGRLKARSGPIHGDPLLEFAGP